MYEGAASLSFNPWRWHRSPVRFLLPLLLLGCGPVGIPERAARPPAADPGFPSGYHGWPRAEPVADEEKREVRQLYMQPDGRAYVKAHEAIEAPGVVTRVDVRRQARGGPFGGWRYESYEPATRKRVKIDPEVCHLCHAAAEDGTYSRF